MPAANPFDEELDDFINGGGNRAYAARYEGRTETERWTIFYDKRRDLLKRLAGESEFHQHQARIAAASIADAAGGSSSSMHPVVPRLVLKVRRDKVLMDSFAQLRRKPLGEMRLQLHIEFEGEDGIDSGGLTKEWFLLVSRELFTPQAHVCLFKQLDVESGYLFNIDERSSINDAHLDWFRFAGRVSCGDGWENRRYDTLRGWCTKYIQ